MIHTPISRRQAGVLAFFLAAIILSTRTLATEVPVRYQEGAARGFLSLRTLDGQTLAAGDLLQVTRAGLTTIRLTFRFKDGSFDGETTVFSQHRSFRVISNHHVQRGPAFPHPIDMNIEALTGQITIRTPDKDGKEKVTSEHMDLPSDLANGMPLLLLKNLDPKVPETEISFLSSAAKPRLVKLAISRAGMEQVSIGGIRRQATNYAIKVKIGGVAGVVAPLVGKQPADTHVWMVGSELPAFIRYEGQMYEGGPIWRVEAAHPSWPVKP